MPINAPRIPGAVVMPAPNLTLAQSVAVLDNIVATIKAPALDRQGRVEAETAIQQLNDLVMLYQQQADAEAEAAKAAEAAKGKRGKKGAGKEDDAGDPPADGKPPLAIVSRGGKPNTKKRGKRGK